MVVRRVLELDLAVSGLRHGLSVDRTAYNQYGKTALNLVGYFRDVGVAAFYQAMLNGSAIYKSIMGVSFE